MIPFLLRDANDKVIGFAVEMEMRAVPGTTTNNTFASDWIVSIPGRGVLWLNSNDNTGSPDLPSFTRPDGSVVQDTTTGPAPGERSRGDRRRVGRVRRPNRNLGRVGHQDPGVPAQLGTFEFEMHIHWDQKPKK